MTRGTPPRSRHPAPAYGGTAYKGGGGGELTNAITFGDRPAIKPGAGKVIRGAIEPGDV